MSARDLFIQAIYLAASVLFILGLKSLSHPDKARLGMQQAAVGMVLAIVGTLFHHEIIRFDLVAVALILGTVIGYPLGTFVPRKRPRPPSLPANPVASVSALMLWMRPAVSAASEATTGP